MSVFRRSVGKSVLPEYSFASHPYSRKVWRSSRRTEHYPRKTQPFGRALDFLSNDGSAFCCPWISTPDQVSGIVTYVECAELTDFVFAITVEFQLRAVYKEDWKEAVGKTLPLSQAYGDNKIEFDIQALLAIIWGRWNDVFQRSLKQPQRNLVSELRDVRNRHAHQNDFSYRDTLRALDTAERLLRAIESPAAASVKQMHDELFRRGKPIEDEPRFKDPPIDSTPPPVRRMTRSHAIARINAFYGANKVEGRNSTFENINTAVPVWWLEIPYRKFEAEAASHYNLLLYDDRSDELYHLGVPTAYLGANKNNFVNRDSKGAIGLHLSTDESKLFRNLVPVSPGVGFKQFLQATACGSSGTRK